jgi:hypothetical protein
MVLAIDHVTYPMGRRYPLVSHIGLRDLDFSLESDLTVCETSSPGICESSSPNLHDFLDVKFPSDEAILEAMILDGRSWEYMHCRMLFIPRLETL